MKENQSLEKNRFFLKLKSWWYRLLHKKEDKKIEVESAAKIEDNKIPIQNFFEEYHEKEKRRKYLMELQEKLKNKEVAEEEISTKDITELKDLYLEQIAGLKREIKMYDNKIAKLKEKYY